jgi:hypothetical protein
MLPLPAPLLSWLAFAICIFNWAMLQVALSVSGTGTAAMFRTAAARLLEQSGCSSDKPASAIRARQLQDAAHAALRAQGAGVKAGARHTGGPPVGFHISFCPSTVMW